MLYSANLYNQVNNHVKNTPPSAAIATILSAASCAATLAFICSVVDATNAGLFFVIPFVLHRSIFVVATALCNKYQKNKDAKDNSNKILGMFFNATNPTLPFMVTFVGPAFTNYLMQLFPDLQNSPQLMSFLPRISAVIVRGFMHTILMTNIDYLIYKTTKQVAKKPKEYKYSSVVENQDSIWRHSTPIQLLTQSILQTLASTNFCIPGLFVAATSLRMMQLILLHNTTPTNNKPQTSDKPALNSLPFLDYLMQSLMYGLIFTFASQIRSIFVVQFGGEAMMIFFSECIMVITRDILDNIMNTVFFKRVENNPYKIDILNSVYHDWVGCLDDSFIKNRANLTEYEGNLTNSLL